MVKLPTAVLAGIAGLAVAGAAVAASRDLHSLNVSMPDGSVAHILYHGDVAPQVRLERPTTDKLILRGLDWPLTSFDRLSAELDRQASLMFYQAAALANEKGRNGAVAPRLASFTKLPNGANAYYESITTTSDGACTRTVHTTSTGPHQAPKVITSLSGNCATGSGQPGGPTDAS